MTNICHRFSFFDQSASAVEAFSRHSRGRYDDFTVTHTKSPVIQAEDYYPFGLVASSYRRENSLEQNFLYNGKELQTDLDLDWYDYGARMYDAEIGRWHVTDNLSENYYSLSPYVYTANNPVYYIDPDGQCYTKGENGEYVPCAEGQEGDTRTGAFGYSWTYGENGWQITDGDTPDPNESSYTAINPDGSKEYYEKRYAEYIKKYNSRPPDYYLEYGYNNRVLFEEAKGSVTPLGSKWIDDTAINLQEAIESGLESSQGKIELDNSEFEDFAYSSHLDAYLESGDLRKMPFSDKVSIMMTPKWEHSFGSSKGRKQIIKMVPHVGLLNTLNPIYYHNPSLNPGMNYMSPKF